MLKNTKATRTRESMWRKLPISLLLLLSIGFVLRFVLGVEYHAACGLPAIRAAQVTCGSKSATSTQLLPDGKSLKTDIRTLQEARISSESGSLSRQRLQIIPNSRRNTSGTFIRAEMP